MENCSECGDDSEWRIILRLCGHFLCVKCALEWLYYSIGKLRKVRIKCPKCIQRIHENDINAILDSENSDLDRFLDRESRQSLQSLHNLNVVEFALGNRQTSIKCPNCEERYFRESGCSLVRCAVRQCGVWFCFQCGEINPKFGHYKKCRLEDVDIYRLGYPLRMAFNMNLFALILMMVSVTYFLLVLFPIGMGILASIRLGIRLSAFTAMFQNVLFGILMAPIGVLVWILCLISAFPLLGLYFLFLAFRCIPAIKTATKVIPRLSLILGVDSISDLISDAREARLLLKVEEIQKPFMESEIIDENLMTPSQALESRITREDHNARYERSLGLNQLREGALDLTDVIIKADEDIDAIKEKRWKDIKGIGVSDVRISQEGLMKAATKVKAADLKRIL